MVGRTVKGKPFYCFKVVYKHTAQPELETLLQISKVLEVDVKDLLNSSRVGEDIKLIKFYRTKIHETKQSIYSNNNGMWFPLL